MALPTRKQAQYWGIAAAVFFLLLWGLGNVILPFVLGGAIAYLLDPLADRLQRAGLSRIASVTLISLAAVIFMIVLAVAVIPTLVNQLTQLIAALPDILNQLVAFISERFPRVLDEDGVVRQSMAQIGQAIQARGGELANTLLTSAMSVINVVVLLVIVPVVAFYLLIDWDRMVARIDDLLPRDHAPVIRSLSAEIDSTLSSFLRGQLTVCAILGGYYAVALMAVGLSYGLVVGAIAGLISFIPYVGSVVGGTLAIGLALFQFWGDWVWIGAVAAIFVLGQVVEGNVLTPKLVGGSVGLHPVWLIFALSAFGALFGFVGMLVAVPVAAALGVIARFAIEQYKDSRLYLGLSTPEPGEAGAAPPAAPRQRARGGKG